MKRLFMMCILQIMFSAILFAQDNVNIYRKYDGESWKVPFDAGAFRQFDFVSGGKYLNGTFSREDGEELMVPFLVETIDSIGFASDIPDDEKGHDRYRVFTLSIMTEGQVGVENKDEWVNCLISVDGRGEYSDYSGSARVKGRGNSSWEWYAKKPYKFKLDAKHKLLGLDKAKDWNLLANYRDVTDMMNTFAFEAARSMGLPHTNHSRYVEVFLDGEYIGVYQLTEKVEVDNNRVDIDKEEGILVCFDQDDGPSLSPGASDNFWSSIYSMPMCVKHPDEPSAEVVANVKTDFAVLESAVKSGNYALVDSLMDIRSFISVLQLHEYLYNVEIDAPRSLYMYKDKEGKYTFGPVWDWDAGYDFDWGNMYTGHTFFTSYKELIYGTDPFSQNGEYRVPRFFSDMFRCPEFVALYKEMWREVSPSIFDANWVETMKYVESLNQGAYQREAKRWPLSKSVKTELAKMENWLRNRKAYLDDVVEGYPMPEAIVERDSILLGTIKKNANCSFSQGYEQWDMVTVERSELVRLLGDYDESRLTLVPLDSDGGEGVNTAAGLYGAWFGADGNTAKWEQGHVYLESGNLYSWNFGCHPGNCRKGDTHTVTMQYRYVDGETVKVVNVQVAFKIS